MLAIGSRLRAYTTSRCVFLILCSPILLPIIFATELLVYTCQKRKETQKEPLLEPSRRAELEGEEEVDRLRRCEEGFGGLFFEGEKEELGVFLLQRYLEDQLQLVGSFVYHFSDDDDDNDDDDVSG